MKQTTGVRPILLVEDSPMQVDLALRAFAKSGLTIPVEVVRDGEEALALIAQWHAGGPQPGLVLLDLKLPKVSGFEVLRALKSHPGCKRIPVVVLTTSGDAADVGVAYDLGANSYIVKPVDFEEFIAVAEEIRRYWCEMNAPGD